MFDFIFSKKPTIILLLAIIVISLVFSIIMNQPSLEGMEVAVINNPPPEVIDQADKILQNKDKSDLEKLVEIKGLLKHKYKILRDIYSKNESAVLKELSSVLSVAPQRDGDGKLYDENALVGEKRENANKVISSNDYSGIEKIEKIKELASAEKAVRRVLDEYTTAWLKMVSDNISALNGSKNDTVAAIASP
jgi:hypothetical protein